MGRNVGNSMLLLMPIILLPGMLILCDVNERTSGRNSAPIPRAFISTVCRYSRVQQAHTLFAITPCFTGGLPICSQPHAALNCAAAARAALSRKELPPPPAGDRRMAEATASLLAVRHHVLQQGCEPFPHQAALEMRAMELKCGSDYLGQLSSDLVMTWLLKL